MGVGGMIGGGIFSVLGLAVGESGHAAPFAFAIGSVIALIAGYSYTRLALTYRSDGASFTYLERAFPKRLEIAGIAGWIIVVGYVGTLALYAFTFGAYASHLIGYSESHIARILLSIGVLIFFMGLNLIGTKIMGRAEDIVVYIKIALLAVLGIVGFFTMKSTNFVPIFNKGIPAIFLGGALIFVAYEGFQLITNAVNETRDPDRNIPRGIFGSIIITSLIYVAIAVISVGNLTSDELQGAKEYALAVVAQPILGKLGVVLVDLAAMLATSSAINATLFGSAHLASQMATDSLAPKAFSFRRPRSDVPYFGIIIITILALAFTIFGNLDMIASFSSMTFLLVSIGVTIANLKLRKQTSSKLTPIILGLALMGITVIILAVYMVQTSPFDLLFTLGVYGIMAIMHLGCEYSRACRMHPGKKDGG